MKGVACSDEPIYDEFSLESAAPLGFIVNFSSLFSCPTLTCCFGSLSRSDSVVFRCSRQLFLEKKL